MMVVANPMAQVQTIAIAPQGTQTLTTNAADPSPTANPINFQNCSAVLIVDHSTPSGSGRAQIANFAPGAYVAGTFNIADPLQFTVQAQSDIICARISTYWVSGPDADGLGRYLKRSDIPDPPGVPGGSMTTVGNIVINDHGAFDILSPGIIDLQLAYAFSTEIHGAPVAYNLGNAWAFTPGGAAPINGFDDWFEVR
jgi:hypothetical protein